MRKVFLFSFSILCVFLFKTLHLKYRLKAFCQEHSLCAKVFPFAKPKILYTRGAYILSLYQTMKDVDLILRHLKLIYWADGGTLIGAMRHGGIIPWDDDCDITMPMSLRKTFVEKAIPIFKKMGYEIFIAGQGMIKVIDKNFQLKPDENPPACDVFFAEEFKDHYCIMKGACSGAKPIFKKDLFPLQSCKFGNLYVSCPKDPKPYLDAYYGEGWMIVAHQEHAHQKNQSFTKGKFPLVHGLYEPAFPLGPLKDHTISDLLK